jgi:carbonic anhydrase
MKNSIKITAMVSLVFAVSACNQDPKPATDIRSEVKVIESIPMSELVENVLTKEEQDALTPDFVIQTLKEGNVRFMNNDLTATDYSK